MYLIIRRWLLSWKHSRDAALDKLFEVFKETVIYDINLQHQKYKQMGEAQYQPEAEKVDPSTDLRPAAPVVPKETSSEEKLAEQSVERNHAVEKTPVREQDIPDGLPSVPEDEIELNEGADASQELSSESAYRMERRGRCVILNNELFNNSRHNGNTLDDRNGSSVDAWRLEKTFLHLNFDTVVKDNLTKTEMVSFINETANEDHTNNDCFVCCVLSHGHEGCVYGTKGGEVPIGDLTGPFSSKNCPTLKHKPKIFIVEACRGLPIAKKTSSGQWIGQQTSSNLPVVQQTAAEEQDFEDLHQPFKTKEEPGRDASDEQTQKSVLPDKDFLIIYPTLPGSPAYREETYGTWHVRKLCAMLNEYGTKYPLSKVLIRVHREVGKMTNDYDDEEQHPTFYTSLERALIFKERPVLKKHSL